MRKLMPVVGAWAGGWLGWVIGATVSSLAGFFLSMIGAGLGMWFTARWASRYY